MLAPRICVLNQKGGAGKSSTVFHLAGYFAQTGVRTLLVDADPQGSLGQGFFGSAVIEALVSRETLAAIFDPSCYYDTVALPVATEVPGVWMIRANQHLARHNLPQPELTGMFQFALSCLLDELPDFDLVLIDCPPNLYQCSWNALLAAQHVLIPVPPEDFGTQGLQVVHQAVEQAQLANPRLHDAWHLVSRLDRRLLLHETYHRKLRTMYADTVLQTVVPEAAAFKVALTARLPVTLHSPQSKAAQVMVQLGDELCRRIATAGQTYQTGVA